jgi:hypothetical protein
LDEVVNSAQGDEGVVAHPGGAHQEHGISEQE